MVESQRLTALDPLDIEALAEDTFNRVYLETDDLDLARRRLNAFTARLYDRAAQMPEPRLAAEMQWSV